MKIIQNRFTVSLLLALCFLLAGCYTAERLNAIKIGMTKDQVIGILGKPDSTSAQSDVEYMTYYLANESDRPGDQPYSVRLVRGQVESFGRFAQLFDIYNRPVNGAPSPLQNQPAAPRQPRPADLGTEIMRLKMLKDQGAITDEEFQKAKDKLLNQP